MGAGRVAKRSGKWSTLEKQFKSEHNTCSVCGTKRRLNVHHIMPFHINPALELEETNLITLCMTHRMCHLYIGHGGFFGAYNPDVVQDAAHILAHPEDFVKMKSEIEARRKSG